MVCKDTSTRLASAFTLTEFLVSLAIGGILFVGVAVLGIYSGRSFAALANYTSLDTKSRNAMDLLTRDVRQVNRLTASTSTSLTFEDADGNPLSYVYSPTTQSLTRTKNGVSKVVLTECDRLEFSVFQRNPVGGTYDLVPTGFPTTAKLIEVNWACSRTIPGNTVDTETVQRARVVIRKQ